MGIEDRRKRLRIVEQVYDEWAKDNPPVNDEYLATDEQEGELLKLIRKKLNQVE